MLMTHLLIIPFCKYISVLTFSFAKFLKAAVMVVYKLMRSYSNYFSIGKVCKNASMHEMNVGCSSFTASFVLLATFLIIVNTRIR